MGDFFNIDIEKSLNLIMKNILLALFSFNFFMGFSEALFHAECKVKWTLSIPCNEAQIKIVDQMNAWDNEDCGTRPGDTEPNGQKCLYHWTGSSGFVPAKTNGTHTTPIHRYVDNLEFSFVPIGCFGCRIDAYSQSTPESILDYGTNYCNLFNLMDGSGLTQDSEFTEETNDAICTQRSIA